MKRSSMVAAIICRRRCISRNSSPAVSTLPRCCNHRSMHAMIAASMSATAHGTIPAALAMLQRRRDQGEAIDDADDLRMGSTGYLRHLRECPPRFAEQFEFGFDLLGVSATR